MITSRRNFLKISGCLTIGFTIGNPSYAAHTGIDLPESLKRHPEINSWIEILANGDVRVYTGKLELGQGIRTAIAQVAAEELEMDVNKIEVVLADTGRTPNEGYTAGSGSMEQSAMAVRFAAAAAKAKLIQLASEKYKVAPAEFRLANGAVHTKNRSPIQFASLLENRQITDKVGENVQLKKKSEYKVVGKPVPRDDIRHMVLGRNDYVHDLRFKGMVHARIVRPPSYLAQLVSLDESYIKKEVPQLLKLIRNGNLLGVICENEFDAVKAQDIVRHAAKWSDTKLPVTSEKELRKFIEDINVKTEKVHEQGKISSDTFSHQASYYKPYLMHGSIGPSCALAIYNRDQLQVWTHSQGVFPLRQALAEMLRMPEEKIRVTGAPGAGCYGHNGADDVAADAALLAIAFPGRHVRLQWSRQDEHLWEPYGSAMIMNVSANLDTAGRIKDWKHDLRSDNHSTRPGGNAGNLLGARYIENGFDAPSGGYAGGAYRNSQPYYTIPNQQVYAHLFKGPLRISALRSLGAYANIFAVESFMDELAEKAKKDVIEFRLMHQEDPRAVDVIKKLRDITKGVKLKKDEGLGIAFSRYKNSASYCAAAAKVLVRKETREIKVLEMWATIDAGEAINPNGIANQTEGGLIQSASWTLLEEVQFGNVHVTSSDWSTYPIMRFEDAPDVHVEVIARPNEEVLGAGEAAQGPAAAAIANAVYRACGIRVRDLPITPERLWGE